MSTSGDNSSAGMLQPLVDRFPITYKKLMDLWDKKEQTSSRSFALYMYGFYICMVSIYVWFLYMYGFYICMVSIYVWFLYMYGFYICMVSTMFV